MRGINNSEMEITPLVCSMWVGSFLGVFLSVGINSVLIQISINAFFNIYYGVLFFALGVLLLYRINAKSKISHSASSSNTQNYSSMAQEEHNEKTK